MGNTLLLSQVCKIVSGNSVPVKEKEELFTGVEGMPYVATKDVGYDGSINYKNGISIPNDYLSKFRVSPAGATLVCAEGGSAGRKIAFSYQDCCYVNKLFSIQPKETIAPRFIYYYVLSNEFQSQFKKAIQGLIGGVSLSKIKDFSITIPPLAEQQRIVAKLDAAFARIDDAIEAVNSKVIEVENLKASLLNDLTSKNIVKLQNVCEIYNGGTPKSNNKSYWDGEIQWLTPKDMGKLSGRYVTNTSRKITIDGLNNSSAKLIPSQSVILSCRAPIGYVFINEVEMSFNQGCKGLVPKNDITVEYLYYFLFSSKKLLNDLGTGTTFKEISGKVLANVPIPLPSILEQKSIVAKLDTAFSKLEIAKNAIIKSKLSYQKLKSTILKQELQSKVA